MLSIVVQGVDDFVIRNKFMKQLSIFMRQAEIRNGEVVVDAHKDDCKDTQEEYGITCDRSRVIGNGKLLLKAPRPYLN